MYSIVDLSGTAGQSNFAFTSPYLSQDHIFVYIDGVETTAFTFNSTFVVHLTTPLAAAATVRIQRITPTNEALVDYNNGSTLGESDLDTATLQLLYVMQETIDNNSINFADCVRRPASDDGVFADLPTATGRANLFLYFDANGNPTTSAQVNAGTLSFTPLTQFFSGDAAATAFTLSNPPGSHSALIVAISGVVQKPGVDFTVSNLTLTFTTAPAVGANNIAVQNFGVAMAVNTVPVGGVVGQLPATQVDYLPAMTGGILRTQDAKNYDMWTVKDFQCLGDGVTSDQTRLVSAVAAAYAAGRELYWPTGTYVSTATIPNFHNVRHRGPGIVKRGSTLFYVDPALNPGVTNNLYVSTTGNDTNDGLAATEPRLTVLSMGNVIYNYPWGNITWAVNLTAGTYTAVSQTFSKMFPTPNRVQFLGAPVSAGVQPLTIVQAVGHGVGTAVVGFYFQNYTRAQVSNINFKNYRKSASPDGTELGIGLTADARSELYTVNVWTDDCDQGIYVSNGSQARIQAGRHGFNSVNGCNVQFIRHSHGSVGYNGTAADVTGATGTAFIGGEYGVLIQEFSMAHTDYCYYSACTQGVFVNTGRAHAVSSAFNTCSIGIVGRMNANLGYTSCTFTACTTDIAQYSGTTSASEPTYDVTDIGAPTFQNTTVGQNTQSLTYVTAATYTIQAKEFQARATGFKLRLICDVSGNAGTKTVRITLGGTVILTAVIAATTTDYEIVVEHWTHTASTTQKLWTIVAQNGVLPVYAYSGPTIDMTASTTLLVEHLVANAADTNRIQVFSLGLTH